MRVTHEQLRKHRGRGWRLNRAFCTCVSESRFWRFKILRSVRLMMTPPTRFSRLAIAFGFAFQSGAFGRCVSGGSKVKNYLNNPLTNN